MGSWVRSPPRSPSPSTRVCRRTDHSGSRLLRHTAGNTHHRWKQDVRRVVGHIRLRHSSAGRGGSSNQFRQMAGVVAQVAGIRFLFSKVKLIIDEPRFAFPPTATNTPRLELRRIRRTQSSEPPSRTRESTSSLKIQMRFRRTSFPKFSRSSV